MFSEISLVGASDHLSSPRSLPVASATSPRPLQVDRLLENQFLRELVLAIGLAPHTLYQGLKVALALDEAHPVLLFGEIALRPTFAEMYRSFLDYNLVVPSADFQRRVHPDLAAAVAKLDLRICSSCKARVLREETECWMCAASSAIAPIMAGFRGVQRMRELTVLEKAVIVPSDGLSANAVTDSVIRLEIPAGSLLVTTAGVDGAIVRYYRFFSDGGAAGYLRVIRCGIRDFVSHITAAQIVAEFPTVPPGFLSWIEFPDSRE